MSDCGSAYMDLNDVQLEVELPQKTLEVTGTSEVINTNNAYSEMEPVE